MKEANSERVVISGAGFARGGVGMTAGVGFDEEGVIGVISGAGFVEEGVGFRPSENKRLVCLVDAWRG